jgi:DNA-directed RNA polymerase sigma subunit (sigma70/sigma32)
VTQKSQWGGYATEEQLWAEHRRATAWERGVAYTFRDRVIWRLWRPPVLKTRGKDSITLREVGEVFGIGANQVRQIWHRQRRKRLRKVMSVKHLLTYVDPEDIP